MVPIGHGMPSQFRSELPRNLLIYSLAGSGPPTSFQRLSARANLKNATLLPQGFTILRNLPQ